MAASQRRNAEPRRSPPPQPAPSISPSDEQNLAEMAHRLETALQRPRANGEPPAAPAPRGVEGASAESKSPRPDPTPKPAAKPAPKPAAKAAFDTLEQEMASLLGRPSGKT